MSSVDWTRRVDNRLLRSLPPEELDRMRSHIAPVPLLAEQVLLRQGQPITEVLFVEDGLISVQAPVADKLGHVEIGLIGNEGLTGISALLIEDRPISLHQAVVHVSGSALRMPVQQLRVALERSPAFRRNCQRYVGQTMGHLAQSVVCASRHSTSQRCARWLLLADDRMPGAPLPLRQVLLAQMLAVHRPGVSAALRLLQDKGCIRQQRGRIEILDRGELERSACECYRHEREMDALIS
ncbi:MAG: Crp/Fnr family transcriptional regulator [Rhodospirillales bacterium]|nr:Crp/Fnr family transcriptional regulator [Rhodospirillales bacterium]